MQDAYKIGDIVLATAGRDEKRIFVIISVIDELYVHIADGKTRRVEKPKKKKIKHLGLIREANQEFIESILKNGKYTNSALRKAIDEYKKSLEKTDTDTDSSEIFENLVTEK